MRIEKIILGGHVMKSTGIVRKVDELGRIVIPREIRNKFEIAEKNVAYTKFWILNPYLSFGGSLINSDIAELFKKTELTKEYYRRINEKK